MSHQLPKTYFSYFQWADLSIPVKYRSYIIEDPYDNRDGFKVTNNLDVMLHSDHTDRDVYHREKLDIIFGKIHNIETLQLLPFFKVVI